MRSQRDGLVQAACSRYRQHAVGYTVGAQTHVVGLYSHFQDSAVRLKNIPDCKIIKGRGFAR